MKFLCDQMLGTLAKWLRIYGFNTFFVNSEMDDHKLLEIARKENRILITRDKNLIQTARRENIKTIEIKTTDIDEQISTILDDIKTDKTKVLSRCILCNTEVEEIKKEIVKGKVPEKVFISNEKFWFCKKCNKIYWKGSHYEKMFEKINNLS
jgi:uncharacterized protein with PIN domain